MANYYTLDKSRVKNSIDFQLSNFNVPSRFKDSDIAMFDNTPQAKLASDFVSNYPNNSECMFFHSSKSGSGKTTLAIAIARELIKAGKTNYNCFFYIADDLFEMLRKQFLDGTNLRSIPEFQRMMRSDLIIIDDMGIEKLTKFVAQRYFYLINAFWNENKKVIITSKFNIIDCLDRAEPDVDTEVLTSIASRMRDMFTEIEFPEKDYRKLK